MIIENPDDFPDLPVKIMIRRRPWNPTLVGVTGTAVRWTDEMSLRIEVDLLPGAKWARVVLCSPQEVQVLSDDSSQIVAR